ncbi:MAG TPA: hypothetical protein ENJ09_05710, partial [Planctomycetes bacterium]|nr:hypothetical protein [Planctomycetota bacterium]
MGECRGGATRSRVRGKSILRGSVLAGLIGMALWILAAVRTSPWADEFHSLHHALRPFGEAFLESVRSDNHPPLSFALEHLSLGLFGVSVLALRLPSLLAGALGCWVLARAAGRVSESAARFAPWLLALSSYSVVIFAEARMYGWLFLAGCGLLDVLLRVLGGEGESDGARWWLSVWLALGLLSHYYFLHVLFVAGVSLGVGLRFGAFEPRRLRTLLAPTLVALIAVAPWYRWAFVRQLTHHLPPGGAEGTVAALVQSLPHFFFLNARIGGPVTVRWIAWPGALLSVVLLLAGIGVLRGFLRGTPSQRLGAVLLLGMGLGVPLWAWVASRCFGRATFGWRYLASALPSVLILVALGLGRLPRLGALLLPAMLAVSLVVASSGGREDYRGAVRLILAEARPGDAILVKPPWDQDPRPEEGPWSFFLERTKPSPKGPVPEALGYRELEKAFGHPRVWLWVRDPYYGWVERGLRAHFGGERAWKLGPDLVLHLFESGGGVG